MNTYIIPGFVIGCIYAIVSSGLVLTYATSGVINLAYGAMAYVSATLFWYLRGHGVGGWAAAAICVLGFAPLFGALLWRVLFRPIAHLSLLAGLMASIGLTVALPAAMDTIFPHAQVYYARGIMSAGTTIHKWGGLEISTDQLSGIVGAVVIAGLLFWLMNYTRIGLRMRAVFDNRRVSSLTGVSPDAVSTFSWALSTSLAALGGILLAPLLSLSSDAFLTVTVASLAAALIGGLRSIGITFVAAIAIGILSSAIAGINFGSGILAQGIEPSLPFLVIGGALFLRRRPLRVGVQTTKVIPYSGAGQRPLWAAALRLWPIAIIVIVTAALLDDYWIGIIAVGFVYSLIFLSLTIAVGDAGMFALGQSAIVGIGGFTAGAVILHFGVSTLPAIILGGLSGLIVGGLLAFAGGRFGTVEFAFLSLAFALFCDNFLFSWTTYVPISGANFNAPSIFGISFVNPRSALYLFAGFFVVGLFLYWLFRRNVLGFLVNATRMNVSVAEATGVNVRGARMVALALSSFLAAVGGVLFGLFQQNLGTTDVATAVGLLWFAVIVMMGARTPVAALVAGLTASVFPAVLGQLLPNRFGELPTILFGLGGLALASDPRGVVSYHGDMARRWASQIRVALRGPENEPDLVQSVR